MASIQNNLQPEIKEETEEEKMDIEYHFHPVISSCEEGFSVKLGNSFILKILWNSYQE